MSNRTRFTIITAALALYQLAGAIMSSTNPMRHAGADEPKECFQMLDAQRHGAFHVVCGWRCLLNPGRCIDWQEHIAEEIEETVMDISRVDVAGFVAVVVLLLMSGALRAADATSGSTTSPTTS